MSAKPNILLTGPMFPEIIELLAQHFVVSVNQQPSPAKQQLIQLLQGKQGVFVTSFEVIDEEVLKNCPDLKIAANYAVGYNNFDLVAMKKYNVIATNTPEVLNEATADLAFTLLMATARRITEAQQFLRDKQWLSHKSSYNTFLGQDIHHSTLAILGMGRIGQAIARRGKFGFNMSIIYHNRRPLDSEIEQALQAKYVSKEQLFEQADHLIVAMPYSQEAYHTIGVKELRLMKPTAAFINIGRGGLVDENALIDALENKQLAGCGLDVFEGEPNINPRFYNLANAVLVPHIGSATSANRLNMAHLVAENLIGYFAGTGVKTPIIA